MPAGALRALFTAIILCSLILPAINVFAQEDPAASEPVMENAADGDLPVSTPDRYTAAEQALTLGDDGTGTAIPPAASVFSIIRVILTLAVVAAAIYGIVYLLKRASRGGSAQDPFLAILASTPLGPGRSAHVISVGSKAWLVGAAEGGVNVIAEIDDKDILDAMLLENSRKKAESVSGPLPDFRAMLRRLGMPESKAPGPEDIRKRSDRLKGL